LGAGGGVTTDSGMGSGSKVDFECAVGESRQLTST